MSAVVVTHTDFHGVPTLARCEGCGERWEWPLQDAGAATLEFFRFAHRECSGHQPPPTADA
jgi:hypothetical protein